MFSSKDLPRVNDNMQYLKSPILLIDDERSRGKKKSKEKKTEDNAAVGEWNKP